MLRDVAVVWMPVQDIERARRSRRYFRESGRDHRQSEGPGGRGPRRYLRSPLGSRGDLDGVLGSSSLPSERIGHGDQAVCQCA
jgi:hypothetical protein